MRLAVHEQMVDEYYDKNTDGFYLSGWDPDHIHFGIFEESKNAEYESDPDQALMDRRSAVLKMTQTIVGPARMTESAIVLDAGCGVGGTALLVAKKYGCRVIGLNINEKQLDIGRKKARDAGLEDRVSFQFCDCSQGLPFENDSADVIVNLESACHFSNRGNFISECARVLKPGGSLVGQDWMAVNNISKENREKYVLPLCDAWYLFEIETLESYVSLLEGTGFHIMEAEYIEKGILPNGYIMRMGYEILSSREAEDGLSDYEIENKERLRTFHRALLGGHLKIGRYFAEKP